MSAHGWAQGLSGAASAAAGLGAALIIVDLLPRSVSSRRWRAAIGPLRRPALIGLLASLCTWLLFGGTWAPAGSAVAAIVLALSAARAGDRRRHDEARVAWPDLLDEIRVRSGSGGLALPNACFLAGRSAPGRLRVGFEQAERTWGLTMDFDRSLHVLSEVAPDPTTRLVGASLSVLGTSAGPDLPQRLDRLAHDRRRDADAHRDAQARMAGARFTRRFVLIVPVGLALAGQSIGTGRAAYASTSGQMAVLVAIAVTALCWHWSGAMLRPAHEQWSA